MHSLRQRINARDESGFTLIELLVVLIIIGILLAIAVPSYLGFRDKAQQTGAAADVREAIPSLEGWYSDNNTYVGINDATGKPTTTGGIQGKGLVGYDQGMSKNLVLFGSASGYCISEANGGHFAKVVGPGGSVQTDPTVTGLCTTAAG
jgi:type IV pilus assembly protein PilA